MSTALVLSCSLFVCIVYLYFSSLLIFPFAVRNFFVPFLPFSSQLSRNLHLLLFQTRRFTSFILVFLFLCALSPRFQTSFCSLLLLHAVYSPQTLKALDCRQASACLQGHFITTLSLSRISCGVKGRIFPLSLSYRLFSFSHLFYILHSYRFPFASISPVFSSS